MGLFLCSGANPFHLRPLFRGSAEHLHRVDSPIRAARRRSPHRGRSAFSIAGRLTSLLTSRHSMKRPLVPVALLYVGGILIALLIPVPPLFLLAGSLGMVALTLAWVQARLVGLCTLIVLTGWTNHTLHTAILSSHDLRFILGEQPDIVTIRGSVRETPTQRVYARGQQESWRTMARVEVTALRRNRRSWQPATGRMAVTTQGMLSTKLLRRAKGRDQRSCQPAQTCGRRGHI
jgi:hypothetical protein